MTLRDWKNFFTGLASGFANYFSERQDFTARALDLRATFNNAGKNLK